MASSEATATGLGASKGAKGSSALEPPRGTTKPPYPATFRREAVRLVREGGAAAQLAHELGGSPDTPRAWVKQTDVDAGRRDGLTTEERQELGQLRREVKRLWEEREILKQAAALFAAERATRCAAIASSRRWRPTTPSRSPVRRWASREAASPPGDDGSARRRRQRAHMPTPPERSASAASIRRAPGPPAPRRGLSTRPRRVAGPAGVLLAQGGGAAAAPGGIGGLLPAAIDGPDRLWSADSTSVTTAEGWRYLAAVLDAFSRRVVGWSMAEHLRTDLALDALTMALQRRQPRQGLIHHSDRGCQYPALAFGTQLQTAGLAASMGSTGDCLDNAVAERCFATRKVELLHRAG